MFQIDWPQFFYSDLRTFITGIILVRAACSKQYKTWEAVTVLGLYLLFSMAYARNGYGEYMYLLVLVIGAKGISLKKTDKNIRSRNGSPAAYNYRGRIIRIY